jgi:hypothetical protein
MRRKEIYFSGLWPQLAGKKSRSPAASRGSNIIAAYLLSAS